MIYIRAINQSNYMYYVTINFKHIKRKGKFVTFTIDCLRSQKKVDYFLPDSVIEDLIVLVRYVHMLILFF